MEDQYDMNGASVIVPVNAPVVYDDYHRKLIKAERESKMIAERKYKEELDRAQNTFQQKQAAEIASLMNQMSVLDPKQYEAVKKSLGLPVNPQAAGMQPYQPLGGPLGAGVQFYPQVYTGAGSATAIPTDAAKPTPPIMTDGTTLRKTMEDAAEFSRSPFAKDSVALEEFGKTGRKPKCIFMSATNGHNLELFELDGYLWVRNTDDDGNMMQVRLGFSERQRMKETM